MKRALPFILIFMLFAGCQVKDYTPIKPADFEQEVTVVSGDFSYDCKVCSKENVVTVTVLSTAAKGMVMSYNGDTLDFDYSGFEYNIDGKNFEKTNPAIAVYEVIDYIDNTPDISIKKIDGGFKYEGRVAMGNFILIQNDDNSLKSLSFRDTDYHIDFKNT